MILRQIHVSTFCCKDLTKITLDTKTNYNGIDYSSRQQPQIVTTLNGHRSLYS